MTARAAIPVWVITGPLGSGKTTIIARWLAGKPVEENWVVLLNEYTDAGIDALTVASAARGAYDVRLIPGGCLCCTGEADFRRNLRDLVEHIRPAAILVEPSGIGHPGGIVEELLAHEASGALELRGVIGLLDVAHLDSEDDTVTAVREIADVLLLAKADQVSAEARARFAVKTANLFPPKAWVGEVHHGQLPEEARRHVRSFTRDSSAKETAAREHRSAESHAHHGEAETFAAFAAGERREFHLLGRHGACWIVPRAAAFSETRLLTLLSSDLSLVDPQLVQPERFKAVLRIDEETWLLVQRVEGRVSMQPTAWRRDNRIEVQLPPGAPWDAAAWERLWQRCLAASTADS